MPYQIGICDDEVYQIKVNRLFLKELADKYQYDFEYHGFQTGEQLKSYLRKNHLDILFLDIDLGEESGMGIATWMAKHYPDIMKVFITGHREFAVEAFEVDAIGYLVKPYDIKKLNNVLNKAISQLEQRNRIEESREIVITEENLKKKIDCRDILYIERQRSKSIIVTEQKEYQVYETITSLCERIGDEFIRVNQGEVVNAAFISEIKGNNVYLKNGKEVAIGRTYRKEVMEKYFG